MRHVPRHVAGAVLVACAWEEFGALACFVDDTGGFGAGWIDALRRLGWSAIGVAFAAKPSDGKYFNKRAEMAFECVQWIKRGGALPESANLLTALTQTTYTFQGDKLLLGSSLFQVGELARTSPAMR
jgi:phage terminase large subunit